MTVPTSTNTPRPSTTAVPTESSPQPETDATGGASTRKRGVLGTVLIGLLVLLVSGAAFAWWATRPKDTTLPEAKLFEVVPNKPLFAEGETQATFILHDDQGNVPTFFMFTKEEQKTTALGINTLRGTPNEQGVEVRFEAVRFLRDEEDPDKLWVRAVGIVNESEGKTPISLATLENGEPLDLHFHDEIKVPYVAHVVYDIYMTVEYDPPTQALDLSKASGSIRWKMLGTDAYDEGKLDTDIHGQKGEYKQKPLLKL